MFSKIKQPERKPAPKKTQAIPVGQTREPIRPGEFLLLIDFRERANMAPHTWRMAKRKAESMGLNLCRKHGRQMYVSTDVWLQMLGLVVAK